MIEALTDAHLTWAEKFTGVSDLRSGIGADQPAPPDDPTQDADGPDRGELKRLLILARKEPVNAAFALGVDNRAVIMLDKHRQPRALEKDLEDAYPDSKNPRFGTVDVPPDDPALARFTVNKASPGIAKRIALALRGTGIKKVRVVLEDGTVDDEGEATEDAAGPSDELTHAADGMDAASLGATVWLADAGSGAPEFSDADAAPPVLGGDRGPNGGGPASADPSLIGQAPAKSSAPGGGGPQPAKVITFKVFVPNDCPSMDKMFRLFEVAVFGKELNLSWECQGNCQIEGFRNKQVPFDVPASMIERNTDPADAQAQSQRKDEYGKLGAAQKAGIAKEADRRFREQSGEKTGAKETSGEARMRDQALASVMHDRELLTKLPQPIKDILFGKGSEAKPEDYAKLLRIADKLKQFTPDDFALYKHLPLQPTNDLKQFEDSIDLFLAHKDEIKNSATPPAPGPGEPTMQDAVNDAWKGFDQVDVAHMSEGDRYMLAQQKADDVSWAQLKYMGQHPGDTLEGFAKSATLMNAPETLNAVGDDLSEVADGDANSWARFGAGAGAGAKLSGLALAALGILYVASWATGIGEAATLAAGASYMLGATLTLSMAEQQLRLKAASQAKTPEEFQHNVNDAAAAQTNIALSVAGIVTAAVFFFTAKALFPEAVENIRASIGRLRSKIQGKVPLADIKVTVAQEMAARKAELLKSAAEAKTAATASAKQIDSMSLDQFVDWAEKNKSFLDNSSVPAEQKVSFRELLKSDVGKKAIAEYKQRLSQSLNTHVVQRIDQLAQAHAASVDAFLAEVDKAGSHDEIGAASDKLDKSVSNEHANELLKAEQDKLAKQLVREAYRDSLAVEKGKLDAKGRTEADGVLQALDEGVISGKPRRPNLTGGEPDHDFVLEEPGKPTRYAEIKTPIDPRSPRDPTRILRPLDDQAKDIATKITSGYQKSNNVDIIINLKNLSAADKPVFLKALVDNGLDLSTVKILNK
jgi:hypothetical protein